MKSLVVYYSLSGKTRAGALALAEALGADTDVEELREPAKRRGVIGFVKSGYHAARRICTPIEPLQYDPSDYDVVVICTPIWAGTMASPVRTYLKNEGTKIKSAAYLLTRASKVYTYEDCYAEMDLLLGRKCVAGQSACSTQSGDTERCARAIAAALKGEV